jgi:hypothetical protein
MPPSNFFGERLLNTFEKGTCTLPDVLILPQGGADFMKNRTLAEKIMEEGTVDTVRASAGKMLRLAKKIKIGRKNYIIPRVRPGLTRPTLHRQLRSSKATNPMTTVFPDLKSDFILANLPFNIKKWGSERLHGDKPWKCGVPPPLGKYATFAEEGLIWKTAS